MTSPGGIGMYANLHIVDLIDSMLVVDPEKRFTIEQYLVNLRLTHPGTEVLAKSSSVLRRQPTMLRSGQVIPLSTYAASSKESQGPKPGPALHMYRTQ